MTKQFKWCSQLKSGNEQIDKEHEDIINILWEIEVVISKPSLTSSKLEKKLLGKVAIYVIDHFIHEEKFMADLRYPFLEQHKKLHKEMTYAIAEKLKTPESITKEDLQSLYDFLYEWVEKHLLIEDYKFIKWKNNEPH